MGSIVEARRVVREGEWLILEILIRCVEGMR